MKKGFYTDKILGKFTNALASAVDDVRSGKETRVCISKANSKMGEVASVSLLPFLTCPQICAESCAARCYAAKIANLYPTVLRSYAVNTALAVWRPELFWAQVQAACEKATYFRFHVSGDIPNGDYLHKIVYCAASSPQTQILVFTKRHGLVNDWLAKGNRLPANLHILYSGWTGLKPVNPYGMPETNIIERGAEPDPSWKECGGNCYHCAKAGCGCWTAKSGDTIAFHVH